MKKILLFGIIIIGSPLALAITPVKLATIEKNINSFIQKMKTTASEDEISTLYDQSIKETEKLVGEPQLKARFQKQLEDQFREALKPKVVHYDAYTYFNTLVGIINSWISLATNGKVACKNQQPTDDLKTLLASIPEKPINVAWRTIPDSTLKKVFPILVPNGDYATFKSAVQSLAKHLTHTTNEELLPALQAIVTYINELIKAKTEFVTNGCNAIFPDSPLYAFLNKLRSIPQFTAVYLKK
jgi:hypothetical protein